MDQAYLGQHPGAERHYGRAGHRDGKLPGLGTHPGKHRMKPLLERDIEKTCCDLLRADGWVVRKMEQNYSERKKKRVGERGMADVLCIRYSQHSMIEDRCQHCTVLWLEFKRLVPSKRGKVWPRATKAAIHQSAWHTLERKRGALTLIAGKDFPASIEGFREWYKESGLMR